MFRLLNKKYDEVISQKYFNKIVEAFPDIIQAGPLVVMIFQFNIIS